MNVKLKNDEKPAEPPLYSIRRLAEYFDCSTYTLLELWHSGKIPSPDLKLSRKSVYWKPETIKSFIERHSL
jgi:hypothetical protein